MTLNGPKWLLSGSFWVPFGTLLGAKRGLVGPFWSKMNPFGSKWLQNRSQNDPAEAKKVDFD